ncbi:hypothetical protein AAFF_G00281740 [Aldrovandia affinis]|uniref:Uncharacterized protein n=1 Tax=Aldrovandia affinis TaxID=143900 RepID=A0AAD7R9U0_9TELE|nr:hypothetical protein AAFF_G00281740 [Aldrovandia affinis]
MVQKLLRLDWGRPLGSQPLPRSLTLLLVPPRARWWDLNTIDIVLWLQDTLWRTVRQRQSMSSRDRERRIKYNSVTWKTGKQALPPGTATSE